MASRALATRLACECTPGKVYASAATLKAHQRTVRHQNHVLRLEVRELRAQLQSSEQERATLSRLVHDLATKPRLRRVTERTKKIVAEAQRWACCDCGDLLPSTYQVDHVVPLWKGGSNDVDNLRAMCPNCHALKTQREAPA